jgi:transposase InsO family protein
MGFAVFPQNPPAREVVAAMTRICSGSVTMPKYFFLDRGTQFDCTVFRKWCQSKGIKIRFGKIGEHGSMARVERFHRSMKNECTRRIMYQPTKVNLNINSRFGQRGIIPIDHT